MTQHDPVWGKMTQHDPVRGKRLKMTQHKDNECCVIKVTGDTIPPICGYNAGQHIYLDAGADRFVSS